MTGTPMSPRHQRLACSLLPTRTERRSSLADGTTLLLPQVGPYVIPNKLVLWLLITIKVLILGPFGFRLESVNCGREQTVRKTHYSVPCPVIGPVFVSK